MPFYVAIVEDEGPERAVGVWFPDLPGCFSAGDTAEEAMRNAEEALTLYAGYLEERGTPLPPARALADLKRDPSFAADIREHMIALIGLPAPLSTVTA